MKKVNVIYSSELKEIVESYNYCANEGDVTLDDIRCIYCNDSNKSIDMCTLTFKQKAVYDQFFITFAEKLSDVSYYKEKLYNLAGAFMSLSIQAKIAADECQELNN